MRLLKGFALILGCISLSTGLFAAEPTPLSEADQAKYDAVQGPIWNGEVDNLKAQLKDNAKFLSVNNGQLMKDAAQRVNQVEVMKVIAENGGDMKFTDPETGDNLLHVALESGSEDAKAMAAMVDFLVSSGVNVNAPRKEDGLTPLLLAARNSTVGKDTVAAILKAKDVDLKATSKDNITQFAGRNALHYAVTRQLNQNNLGEVKEIVQMLLDKGADVKSTTADTEEASNYRKMTALHLAAEVSGDRKEIAELLLAKGADINAQDGNGKTPLLVAVRSEYNAGVCKLLLEKGADINLKDKNGVSALSGAENSTTPTSLLVLEKGKK